MGTVEPDCLRRGQALLFWRWMATAVEEAVQLGIFRASCMFEIWGWVWALCGLSNCSFFLVDVLLEAAVGFL